MKDQYQDQLHLLGIDPLQGRKLFVRKRDGRIEEFNEARICLAIESAFKAVEGIGRDANLPVPLQTAVKKCADTVVERMFSRAVRGEQMEVERIQDAVEDQLMLDGHLAVARCYILYREKRRQARAEREGRAPSSVAGNIAQGRPAAGRACAGRSASFSPPTGAPVVAQDLQSSIAKNAVATGNWRRFTAAHFSRYIHEGEYLKQLAPELLDFDLDRLAGALRLERDELFPAAGLQALHDDYLLHDNGRRIETPQYFWMRLAMGLALNEGEQRSMRARGILRGAFHVPFRSIGDGPFPRRHAEPRLMNCFAATSWNDLEHVIAQTGPRIRQRKKTGLTCSWLEPWHIGIWDFLQRPPAGGPAWDHDLNKALWVPDLFMKRVREQGQWTLFEPAEVPDLHQTIRARFRGELRSNTKKRRTAAKSAGSRESTPSISGGKFSPRSLKPASLGSGSRTPPTSVRPRITPASCIAPLLHRHFAQFLAAGSRRLQRRFGQSRRASGRPFLRPAGYFTFTQHRRHRDADA